MTSERRRGVVARRMSARQVADRVRQVVGGLFADGREPPDLRITAGRIGTSTRTLQRQLHATGLTYARVTQAARRTAAEHMLLTKRWTIGAIARKLGYSDHAHFTRAFQRWTGLTPRDFRRRGRPAVVGSPRRSC